jgi:oxaloacetate decarboxylase alpha subunit
MNVVTGERYKMVPKESKDVVMGKYGKTPAPMDPEFVKKILKGDEQVTCRPADLLEPELDKIRAEAAEWVEQEEDVLTYGMFPQVAEKYFRWRRAQRHHVDESAGNVEEAYQPV